MIRFFQNKLTAPLLTRFSFFSFLLFFFVSCVEVKNIPQSGVYTTENKVDIVNNKELNKQQEKDAEELLSEYVDDSIKVGSTGFFGIYKKLIASGAFDTAYLSNSERFMRGYLNAEGFYNAKFDTVYSRMDTVLRKSKLFGKEKQVVEVKNTFVINLGPPLRIDTMFYNFRDSALQSLAKSALQNTLLKQGNRYKKSDVAAELDRLSGVFRNNGYFRMSRSALLTEADTTDPALVSSEILDPFETIRAAQERLENPTVKLRIFERPGADYDAFRVYTVDSVFIYPDTRLTDEPDSLYDKVFPIVDSPTRGPVYVKQNTDMFRPGIVRRQNFIYPNRLYTDSVYYRTINNFNGLGPWQQIVTRTHTHITDTANKVDFHLFLVPAKKRSLQLDIEGSQNNNLGSNNVLAGSFMALGFNVSNRNRNAFRRGIQTNTIARTGFELNTFKPKKSDDLPPSPDEKNYPFQTFISNINHSYTFPTLLWPMSLFDKKRFAFSRTKLSFDWLHTNRIKFFRQTSIGTRLQWSWRKNIVTHTVTFPNFETVFLDYTDSLLKVIQQNPSLILSFRQGTIFSGGYSYFRPISYHNPKHNSILRMNAELTVPGPDIMFERVYFQFFKVDGQFQHEIRRPGGNSWNFRFFGGVGWELNKQAGLIRTLPYYRQFVAGGANSMRAWQLRQLGLGSSIVSDTSTFNDRFGDIQLEWNAEYRFKLFRWFGFDFNGVGFVDIGNVWNHYNQTDGEGKFEGGRLYNDLAVAAGTGLRLDLSFLILRLDFGIKLKDPVREGAGWMKSFTWKEGNRIPGTIANPNYALQFGVGYPF